MLEFKELSTDDRIKANSILYNLNYRLCEYCFGDLYIWRKVYSTRIAFSGNFMFIKFINDDTNYYLFPAGSGDLQNALRLIYEDAKKNCYEFHLACVTPEMKAELEKVYPDRFDYQPTRDSYDYIYNASDLISLSGRKFHSKRNHIARFEKLVDWQYEDITRDNIDECSKMNDEWCKINGCGTDLSLGSEHCAVVEAFKHYFELGLSGGLIRLGGKIVAFTMGQKLCGDTFIVHIEKAFSDVEGAYAMINREFAAHHAGNFAYINREDDAGVEGLRKAKLSYRPAILLEKNIATPKAGANL